MSGVRHITVGADDEGQRLDRWIKRHAPEIPFGLAQKLMRQGQVRVDGKRAKPDTRLKTGQDIRLPPVQDKPQNDIYRLTEKDEKLIRSWVIYDDGDVLAINKPYGIATQGGMNIERHIDGMLEGLTGESGVKPRLVHRLDKETSGVLLLARSADMARLLGKIFSGRHIRKIYWAITSPAPEMNDGEIKAPLSKGLGSQKDKMVVDEAEGQTASTLFQVIDRAHRQAAFIAFWPRTGRTHQIRVHAAYMGCPIAGDRKYALPVEKGDHVRPQIVIDDLAKRLHLHAAEVTFRHPGTGKTLTLKASLPPELKASWKTLGFQDKTPASLFEEVRDFRL
jgi:23S rRNA pseudouridine955/2504/2580 synthase